jgi:hypothetical protein
VCVCVCVYVCVCVCVCARARTLSQLGARVKGYVCMTGCGLDSGLECEKTDCLRHVSMDDHQTHLVGSTADGFLIRAIGDTTNIMTSGPTSRCEMACSTKAARMRAADGSWDGLRGALNLCNNFQLSNTKNVPWPNT